MRTILSLRDVRLTSTLGHTALVPANVPTLIPDVLLTEAILAGCVETDKQPSMGVEVAAPVLGAPALSVVTGDSTDELTEEDRAAATAPVEEEAASPADTSTLGGAVAHILELGDPDDFKIDGSPTAWAVYRVMGISRKDPDAPKADAIAEEYVKQLASRQHSAEA
jgi:hypothetical protein